MTRVDRPRFALFSEPARASGDAVSPPDRGPAPWSEVAARWARIVVRDAAIVVALVWGFVLVLAWALQERLLFPAPTTSPEVLARVAADHDVQIVPLVAADGTRLTAWWRDGTGRGAVLHFLGNGEDLTGALPMFDVAREHGLAAGAVAYRGYPGSPGSPSAAGAVQDGRALWAFALSRGHRPDDVVISGLSLGGGVAAALASEVRPGGLVLQSTFTRLSDAASHRLPLWPVRPFLRHRLDTVALVDRLPRPLLVVHGDQDDVVPVDQGRALHAALPGSVYVEIPGGVHAGYATAEPRAFAALGALLDQVASP